MSCRVRRKCRVGACPHRGTEVRVTNYELRITNYELRTLEIVGEHLVCSRFGRTQDPPLRGCGEFKIQNSRFKMQNCPPLIILNIELCILHFPYRPLENLCHCEAGSACRGNPFPLPPKGRRKATLCKNCGFPFAIPGRNFA